MHKNKTTAGDSNVVDFNAKKEEKANSLKKLISTGSLENINKALNLLPNKNISLSILEYLYNEAVEFFDAGKAEQAKVIFLKMAHLERQSIKMLTNLETVDEFVDLVINIFLDTEETETSTTIEEHLNEQTEYYIDNSNLNLGIIYSMENNPELSDWHSQSNILLKKIYGIKPDLRYLLHTYNNYQTFKNEFGKLTKNFSNQERKNLIRYFFAIHKDYLKEFRENYIRLDSLTENHLLQIKNIIGKEKFANKELLAKIEKFAFEFASILRALNVVLLGDGLLELNFLERFQFNKIDLDKNTDYYIEQLKPYIKQKISDVRKTENYETFSDDLETNRNINTKQASDLEILDAFLKNCLAYSRRFLTAVLETFLEK